MVLLLVSAPLLVLLYAARPPLMNALPLPLLLRLLLPLLLLGYMAGVQWAKRAWVRRHGWQ